MIIEVKECEDSYTFVAHNPKVVGSSPTPATTEMPLLKQFTEDFLLLGKIHLRPLKTVKKH